MEADYQMSPFSGCVPAISRTKGELNAKETSLAEMAGNNSQRKGQRRWRSRFTAQTDFPTTTRLNAFYRNCQAGIIYEGTRDIHTLMQADWALGAEKEKAVAALLFRVFVCRSSQCSKRRLIAITGKT